MEKVTNVSGLINSLQISTLGDCTEGKFSIGGQYFLVKNITDEPLSVQVHMANEPDESKYVTTVLYPGWNVELVNGLKDVISKTLQYGY